MDEAAAGLALILVLIWALGAILGIVKLGQKGYLQWWRGRTLIWWIIVGWWLAYVVFVSILGLGGWVTFVVANMLQTRWGYGDNR